ncbi:MAG TPA: alpha/beta hydrolase [Candidatus Acidoferrum sp.]|nr:alpha/beta hydrolase [Candidatus Acidoferrum sp.]
MSRVPELKFIPANGQQIAVWDWPGEGPPFLFAHATGFHGRCWDRILAHFPERRCMAVDSRGHGRSTKPAPPAHWRDWGRDLAAVAAHFDLRDTIGIGHSMGGHITVQCAALRPETYRALLLIDPTIFPRELYGAPFPDVSFTLRRKNRWTGPDEMYERFKDRLPFSRWDPAILRDYCDYGVLPDGDGFVLACPPPIETSIYENSRTVESDIYPEIARVRQRVVLMRAARSRRPDVFELGASPTAPDLVTYFANASELVMEDSSHFIAMEAPERVAEEIARLAE